MSKGRGIEGIPGLTVPLPPGFCAFCNAEAGIVKLGIIVGIVLAWICFGWDCSFFRFSFTGAGVNGGGVGSSSYSELKVTGKCTVYVKNMHKYRSKAFFSVEIYMSFLKCHVYKI